MERKDSKQENKTKPKQDGRLLYQAQVTRIGLNPCQKASPKTE